MDKQPKPLSTKKPPVPSKDHKLIEDWMENRIMPGIQPLIKKIDSLIHDCIPNLQYAIKWGKAYYGTSEQGWLIEVAAYDVSANIVFLMGADLDPQPPLGKGESRYFKLREMDELGEKNIASFLKQAGQRIGWK
ncbi:DUF1801 domain-containing protein [Algoriphagus sediminis]|uniref:DUF1801 domain-containing protein n=1 Tax=Algoriphagus sediminis TaxID=3057113 RepID=A0ABT7YDM0_9BACT|nr:DUF1801 domain-containing protein [Algoriphagus sediminis]MDN3204583.1 DUF1801 domain-containing protein [Algoriphagus sediminis]